MPHTVTLTGEQLEAAVRSCVEALAERLADAAAELEGLLEQGSMPTQHPRAADVDAHLRAVEERIATLRSLGWPTPAGEGA